MSILEFPLIPTNPRSLSQMNRIGHRSNLLTLETNKIRPINDLGRCLPLALLLGGPDILNASKLLSPKEGVYDPFLLDLNQMQAI